MNRLKRDGTAESVSQDQIVRREHGLTTSMIGMLTRLIHTLLDVMTTKTNILSKSSRQTETIEMIRPNEQTRALALGT